MQTNLVLGIGDLGVSDAPSGFIKTFALGSCVAVVLYDKMTNNGGMIHIALPNSETDKAKSETKPGYFADTGIPLLLKMMKQKNPQLSRKYLSIKLAGGASIMDADNFFNIGKKNILKAREVLSRFGLTPEKEDVGGNISRTVTLDISSGMTLLFNPEKGVWEL